MNGERLQIAEILFNTVKMLGVATDNLYVYIFFHLLFFSKVVKYTFQRALTNRDNNMYHLRLSDANLKSKFFKCKNVH